MRLAGLILASILFPAVAWAQSCPGAASACPPLSTSQINLGGAIVGPTGVPLTPPVALPSAGQVLTATDNAGHTAWQSGGTGSVTQVSGQAANGLTVSVANATTTPQITVGTALSGLIKGNGASFSTAVAGTDYLTPNSSGAALTGLTFGQLGGSLSPSQIPTPTTSALGGVQATTQTAHEFLTGISTGGIPSLAQPAFGDLSGNPSSAQITGGLGFTPLAPANNLSDLSSASGARTNLGLGTLATQSANAVAVTGGTIDGTCLGCATPGAGAFTTFQGWAPRFAARMDSNPTPASGGTGNATGDALTLNAGCATNPVVTVQSTSGAVVSYNITNPGVCTTLPANPLSVLSTTGTGTGAQFNLSWDPWSAATSFSNAVASGNNGNFILGASPGRFSGTESLFVGGLSPSIDSGNFITDVGVGSCGIGSGTTLQNASFLWCVGSNAGRNVANGASLSMFAGTFGSATSPNITGTSNFVFQIDANPNLTTGNQNAMYASSCGLLATGSGNFCAGFGSGLTVPSASSSVVIGGNPNGGASTAGARCPGNSVCVGANSGNPNITGADYILVGPGVGNTTCGAGGIKTVLIGFGIDCTAANTSQWLNIDSAIIASVSKPTLSSGFGTSASVPEGTSSAAFQVNVGTGGTASSGVIQFASAAPNGWICHAVDVTNPSTSNTVASGTSTQQITLTNFSRTAGTVTAWAASDIINVNCNGF
jgi:hypothetical protein